MKYKLIGEDSPTLGNIFKNRGLILQNILGVTEKALHDPFLMKNMDKAVETVKRHMDNNSLIVIQQDPDADGYTSTAVLHRYLKMVKPDINIVVLIHSGKAHGIEETKVYDILEEGIEPSNLLVISPDASSNEHDLHKRIADCGVDIVILDHHEADAYSPHAVMVNPSLDEYPNKLISGVGVTQKFAKAYDMKYGYDFADQFYDLVAVGMIADMIELTSPETVYIIQKGMREINSEFLKTLYDKQSYSMKGAVTPTGVSFYIAPLINAVTRTATFAEKQLITEAMCLQERKELQSTKRGAKQGDIEVLHEQAVRVMANIKARQGREVDKAITKVEEIIESNNLNAHQLLIVDAGHSFKREYTGLIANKLMAELQKPVLLGNTNNGELSGSGRTYDKSELADLRGFLNESGLVTFAEGHAAAHGFGVKVENVPLLLDYANEKLKGIDFSPVYRIDFTVEYDKLDLAFLEQLTTMATYWGRGFDEPYFMIKDMPVSSKDVEITGDFGSKTVKITKPGFSALQFRLDDHLVQSFIDNEHNVIDLIGRVTMSEYKGQKQLTIFMADFEFKRQQKYYF